MFGARGTGKSTFIREQFPMENPWVLDLLDPEVEDYYAREPKRLELEFLQRKKKPDWVVIDEVQKVPRLLNVVHRLIELKRAKFVLTGSSARKLKRGAANLLAGRAFVQNLFPLTHGELGEKFSLADALHYGTLPKIHELNSSDRVEYLHSYVLTYLAEEVRAEQLVRRLDPFRAFLPILGQMSGKVLNFSKIAREIGVDTKTVQTYFQIIEDTLLGFYLPAFHESIRKSQKLSPKFYVFDCGVKKALEGSLDQIVSPRTSVYGEQFESFLIQEIVRLNFYSKKFFQLSYFGTSNDFEFDLVLSKGGKHQPIEIKSSTSLDSTKVERINHWYKTTKNLLPPIVLSCDPHAQKVGVVKCLPWEIGLKQLFGDGRGTS